MSNETDGVLGHNKAILLAAMMVLSLVSLPLIVAFATVGWRFLFNLLAADSMYYMGIANNWAKFGFPTFDGEQITNGFHPLWGTLLAGMFWISGASNSHQLYVAFAASLVFVLMSLTLLSSLAMRHLGVVKGATATLLMFPGAYALLGTPASRTSGDPGVLYRLEPWSAVNGMESTLSLALWSLAIYLLVRRLNIGSSEHAGIDQSGGWTHLFNHPLRVVLAAIVLARLDDTIVLAPIAASVWVFNSGTTRQRLQQISQILLLPVLALGGYALLNFSTTGSPLPVSGARKTGLALAHNVPMLTDAVSGVTRRWEWIYSAERAYPLIFCAALSAIAVVLLNTTFKGLRDTSRLYQLALILLAYVLIKSSFFICCVGLELQGYWYNFVTVLMLNFMIAMLLARSIPTHGGRKYAALLGAALVTILAIGTEAHMLSSRDGMLGEDRISNYAQTAYLLWTHKQEIRAAFSKRDPAAKLIDNLDGMYGFLLDLPAVSVTGLASGRKDLDERRRVGFWNSVLPRGYSIISAVGYEHVAEEKGLTYREFYTSADGKLVFFQVVATNSVMQPGASTEHPAVK
jgi:hypothetical protein